MTKEALAGEYLRVAGGAPLEPATLDARITEHYERGRAAWPEVSLAAERFAAHLAGRAADVSDVAAWLGSLHADGLYLACACLAGDARALSLFEERLLSQLPAQLARISPSPTFVDELRQQLREKLLTGPSPKLAEYSGEGPLGAWLRVVARRAALSELRKRTDTSLDDRTAESAALGAMRDPELDYIRSRYQHEFAGAIKDSLAVLPSEQRNLLKLHFLDGLSIDKLAVLFQIHRATAARWLQAARTAVFDETRRRLQERLQLQPRELESLMRVLGSQLEVSLSGVLKTR